MTQPGQTAAPVVLGIDLGTTGVKVVALDVANGRILCTAGREYPSAHLPGGGHEQDPRDWWQATSAACHEVTSRMSDRDVVAVGLSGQMHSLLLLDADHRPVAPAMTWADRRVSDHTRRLAAIDGIRALTGNEPVDAFTAPKLAWFARERRDDLARAGALVLAKDYLGGLLTGDFATDLTDAVGTLLWDVEAGDWSSALFEECGVDPALAPEVRASAALRGTVTPTAAAATGIRAGTPVMVGAGDVSATVLGCGVVDATTVCVNVGTAAQAMGIVPSADAGAAFLFGNAAGTGYVAMASVYAAGASVRWAEETLLDGARIDAAAGGVPAGAQGLTYLPYMFGAAVPRRNDAIQAAFLGQSPAHDRTHLAAAVLEGVAFAVADAVDAVAGVAGDVRGVNVVGGVTASPRWRAALAGGLSLPVHRLPHGGSVLGAALLAALGSGVLTDAAAVPRLFSGEEVVVPPADREAYLAARDLFARRRDALL